MNWYHISIFIKNCCFVSIDIKTHFFHQAKPSFLLQLQTIILEWLWTLWSRSCPGWMFRFPSIRMFHSLLEICEERLWWIYQRAQLICCKNHEAEITLLNASHRNRLCNQIFYLRSSHSIYPWRSTHHIRIRYWFWKLMKCTDQFLWCFCTQNLARVWWFLHYHKPYPIF